jgi:hypothetical protein
MEEWVRGWDGGGASCQGKRILRNEEMDGWMETHTHTNHSP